MISTIVYQSTYRGFASRWAHTFFPHILFRIFFSFYLFIFFLSLLQCEFNIVLLFTPYDAQARSACSALIFLLYMGMAAILVMWPSPFVFIFISVLPTFSTWYLVSNISTVFEKKIFKLKTVTFGKCQIMILTFDTHVGWLDYLVQCIYKLWDHGRNSFWKIN